MNTKSSSTLPVSAAAVASAWLAVGVAVWLLPSSIHVVDWGGAGVGRVGVFAPAYQLRWALAAASLLALATWFVGERTDTARARRAWVLAPLSSMWTWGLPFLPGLPDRLPLLLVLAGPLRLGIAAAAGAAVASRAWRAAGLRVRPWTPPGRRTAFVLALVLFLWSGYRSVREIGPGGDEPHYLVITQSLLLDGDLRIENNHARGDYRKYYGGLLNPDYLVRGTNGEIYSVHAPGLPALLAPAFAVAGAWGAVATVAVLAALGALAVFDTAVVVGGQAAAWPSWAAVCFTVPFVPHAWLLFPEAPGAAIAAWAALWSVRDGRTSSRAWWWRGVCLALLPWLHTKFVVLLAGLFLMLAARVRRQVSDLVGLTLPVACSLALWLAFFYAIYGSIDPQVPYGGFADQFVRMSNVPRGTIGSLVDAKFGLLLYAPIYLVVPWGAMRLWRDQRLRWTALALGGTAVAYLLSSARFYMWWGGSSAPARFLVPVTPLLAPAIAAVFRGPRTRIGTPHVWAALGMSLAVTAFTLGRFIPQLLYSNAHGVSNLAASFGGGSPLASLLPTFTEEQWASQLLTLGGWVTAAAGAVACGAWFAGRRPHPSLFWAACVEGTTFGVVAALLVGPAGAAVRTETVQRGRLSLLQAFDPDARRGLDYRQRFVRISPPHWLESSHLTFTLDASDPPDPKGRLTEALPLPPGEYDVSVLFDDGREAVGDVVVATTKGQELGRSSAERGRPVTIPLRLPVGAPDLQVRMEQPESAAAARRVDIVPRAVQPRSARPSREVRGIDVLAGRNGAFLAYLDGNAYPEGGVFWTRGYEAADVAVSTGGAAHLTLTIHGGPIVGSVRLTVDGDAREIPLVSDQTVRVPLVVSPSAPYVRLRVQSSAAFRPRDVDPRSEDVRLLGAQVRVELDE